MDSVGELERLQQPHPDLFSDFVFLLAFNLLQYVLLSWASTENINILMDSLPLLAFPLGLASLRGLLLSSLVELLGL